MTIVSGSSGYLALLEDGGNVRLNSQAPMGTEAFVSFSFFDAFPTYNGPAGEERATLQGFEVMTAGQKAAIRSALSLYSAASGVTFIEVPGDNTTRGDIVFGMVPEIPWASAFAYLPEDGMDRAPNSLSGEVWFSEFDVGSMAVGDWGYFVAIHEIGHAIGFKHPFEGDPILAEAFDNTDFTVMAYNVTSIPTQLRNYDINAAETLYGSRGAANGNGITGVWDPTVQLVRITGSAASEVVLGTGWHDTISAGGGNDTVFAGSGNDIVTAGDGNDTVFGGYGNDTIDGGAGSDALFGGIGNDTLTGGSGADSLDGGTGDDVYRLTADSGDTVMASDAPGTARNTADFSGALGGVQITLTAVGGSAVLRSGGVGVVADNLVGAFDVFVATAAADVIDAAAASRGVEILGAAGADTITGSSADDSIRGGADNDTLIGGGGSADVAFFARPRWEYSLTGSIGSATLAGLTAAALAADGTDTLSSIEFLDFAGTRVATTTALSNALPVATATGALAPTGSRRLFSELFNASDANGQAIASYSFQDLTPGNARLVWLPGSGATIDISDPFFVGSFLPSQLGQIFIEGGADGAVDQIRIFLSDGIETSAPEISVTSSITATINHAPAVTQSSITTVAIGGAWSLGNILLASDPDGDPITGYEFRDNGAGGGSILQFGSPLAAGVIHSVSKLAFDGLIYQGGAIAGTETIDVRASDGSLWSPWFTATISTIQPNRAPEIVGGTPSVGIGASIAASSLFSVSDPDGNPITSYEFLDLGAGGGSLRLGGVTQGGTFTVAAADLGTVTYVGGPSVGSESVRVRVSDGDLWSTPTDVLVLTGAANRAPVIGAGAASSLYAGAQLVATSMFSANDPDGHPILAYEFRDNGAGGGQFRLYDVPQAAGVVFSVSPVALSTLNLLYVAGPTAGSETFDVRASDGSLWSPWSTLTITTVVNQPPVVVAGSVNSVFAGSSVSALSLFTASDPDFNPIQSYFFKDNGVGGGQFRLSGVPQSAGSTFVVSPADITNLVYDAGAVPGSETIEVSVSDGSLLSSILTLTITTVASAPEIVVQGQSVTIIDGDATPTTSDGTDFGIVLTGAASPVTRQFSVSNSGNQTLFMSGLTLPTGFTLIEGLAASIAPGASDSFTVRLDPGVVGIKSGQITFATNDADENPFNFSITGEVLPVPPEIAVSGAGTVIADGDPAASLLDDTDFGTTARGAASVQRTFTVTNSGGSVLTTSGLVVPTGFSIVEGLAASIAAGGSDTFTVRLDTTTSGTKAGDISFTTNDSDENPFNFAIRGVVTGTPPEVAMSGGGFDIVSGDATPSIVDGTDFGSVTQGGATVTRTFLVTNTGETTLTTGGIVSLPLGYTLVDALASEIAPGGSDSFALRLDTTVAGVKSAEISFVTNDADENPFTFAITGTVVGAPEVSVTGLSSIPIADGDALAAGIDGTDFGSVTQGAGVIARVFTVTNSGGVTLTTSGLSLPIGFSLFEGLAVSIAPGASDTFVVHLDTAIAGVKSGQISFATNDSDENPFNFAITGVVDAAPLPAEIAVSSASVNIVDGDTTPASGDNTDFGSATQGGAVVLKTFTVANSGGSTLTTSGLVLPTGFTLVEGLSASIAAGGSDSFTLQLDTSIVGTKSGQISFATNDSDENPFNFSITGTVNAAPLPAEIAVSGASVNIVDGDTTPTSGDNTDFGAATQGGAVVQKTFTVTNSGGSTLTTSGLVLPTGFTLVEGLTASIAAGGSDTFTLQLDTSIVGTKSGQISFTTNDSDENPFNFSITGVVSPTISGAAVISAATSSVAVNQWILASALFTAIDPQGDTLTRYRFTDLSAGGGYLYFTSTTQPVGTPLEVTAAQLSSVWFRGSATGGVSDTVRVEAYDGTSWGSGDLPIATLQPNRAPSLSVTTSTSVSVGGTLALNAMFNVSDPDGNAITAYEIWDSNGGGQFRMAGSPLSSGAAIAVTPAQLATVVYAAGATPATESIWVRAKDSVLWSSWLTIPAITISGPLPAEVSVSGASINIVDGDTTPTSGDNTDFGAATQGGAVVQKTFTVANSGGSTLTTSGLVLPTGFTLVEGLSASIAAGGSDSFTVQLDTAVVGTKSGQISFTTNDSDENPFNFAITGTVNAVVLPAEIEVSGASVNIVDGDATPATGDNTDFGSATQGGAVVQKTFTVANAGGSTLTTSGLVLPTGFTLVDGLSATIAAGASDTFTIQLDTAVVGTKSGEISFTTNDSDENPFNFAITGTVNAVVLPAEIAVSGASVNIVDGDATPATGDNTDFGSATQGGAVVQKTFTVANSGGSTLTTSGLVLPTGFTLVEGLSATIAAGNSDAFTVQLDTAVVGTKTGEISFTTNDGDENPFNFAITGTVTAAPLPAEIAVSGASVNIVDGDATPATGDNTDFGSATQGGAVVQKTFTVTNTGGSTLTTSGLVLPTGFTLVEGLSATIAAGNSDAFTVQLDTAVVGTKTGEISFTTNDSDENPFNFAITGTVTAAPLPAEIAVSGASVNIVDGDATPAAGDNTDFGAATQGGTVVQKTFTVANAGGSTLTTSSLVLPTGFTLVEGLSASIAAGASDTFTVQLDTAVVGTKTGEISFTTNDSDENPFNFAITGTVNAVVLPAEIAVSGASVNIVDGDATPATGDNTDFGAATQGGAVVQKTFTVANAGGSTLATSGLVLPTGFTLVEGLSASIAAGGSDTFTVQLDTAVVGTKSGQISFTTNDSDENPFNFAITGIVNAATSGAPIINAATSAVNVNQWVLASVLFTASDPQGDAITRYRFTDLSAGGGYLYFSSATQTVGVPLEIAASQLSSVWFRGGATGGGVDTLRIEAFDGSSWGSRELGVTTSQPNRAPILAVTAATSVAVGGTIALSSMFSVSDPDGHAITAYEIWDSNGGGQFRMAGSPLASGAAIAVTPAQLTTVVYAAGATPAAESIWVRAKDSALWSNWLTITASTIGAAAAPKATAAGGDISALNALYSNRSDASQGDAPRSDALSTGVAMGLAIGGNAGAESDSANRLFATAR